MRRPLALLLLAAALAGCAGEPAALRLPGDEPLAASADLGPRTAAFGDPVTATVRVLFDPVRVRPESLRLKAGFGPWRATRTVEREDASGLASVTYTLHLTCLTGPCVSDERQARFFFPDAELTWREGGTRGLQVLAWPDLTVMSRLPPTYVPPEPGDLTPLPWRAAVTMPEPTYRVSPAWLRWGLAGLGVLLIAASVGLAAAVLRAPRAPREVPPLERALALLERARTPAERRAALEAIAAELHPALAAAARELAWSETAPSEPAARELTARVRGADA